MQLDSNRFIESVQKANSKESMAKLLGMYVTKILIYFLQNGQDGLQIHFEHQFTTKDEETYTYFSFVEPWGYDDSTNYFTTWHEKIKTS